MYTTTINQNGMILLNKDARKALGVKLGDKVTVDFDKDGVKVSPRSSDKAFFAILDKRNTPKTIAAIKRNAGKTASELRKEWAESAEGKKYLEERYNVN